MHQGLHKGFAPGGLTRLGCKDVRELCGAVFVPGLCTRGPQGWGVRTEGVVWGCVCTRVCTWAILQGWGVKDVRELCWGCLCTRALHEGISQGWGVRMYGSYAGVVFAPGGHKAGV